MSILGRLGGALVCPWFIGLSGCGVPSFDLPVRHGAPTVETIVQRIECELISMVKKEGRFPFTRTLIEDDYQVGVALSLDVTDFGELSPSLNFPYDNIGFGFNAGIKLNRSREQNFSQNLFFSMRQLKADWEYAQSLNDPNGQFGTCPNPPDTNLAGDLGLKETVALAFTASNRRTDIALDGAQGQFGGFVNFIVTKNVNAVGPTWTLTHFKGPGNLGTFSRVNTDKITFAFAAGPGGPIFEPGKGKTAAVEEFLRQLILTQIND